ncbi:MAG: homoprotocatechuate degradation operon regulator HpaR, partial [Bradyrhizobium sp.]|nr:homoprotocatechuate degradation operon regulator HpaR [Bradyrhizobium sp.]
LRLIALVAPSSEAVYASISERYGARKLAALHKMLDELEQSVGPDLEPDDRPDE